MFFLFFAALICEWKLVQINQDYFLNWMYVDMLVGLTCIDDTGLAYSPHTCYRHQDEIKIRRKRTQEHQTHCRITFSQIESFETMIASWRGADGLRAGGR